MSYSDVDKGESSNESSQNNLSEKGCDGEDSNEGKDQGKDQEDAGKDGTRGKRTKVVPTGSKDGNKDKSNKNEAPNSNSSNGDSSPGKGPAGSAMKRHI